MLTIVMAACIATLSMKASRQHNKPTYQELASYHIICFMFQDSNFRIKPLHQLRFHLLPCHLRVILHLRPENHFCICQEFLIL